MERHVEAAIDAPQTQAPESIWERRFTMLEEEISMMRASMEGLNKKIDELTIQNDKSEKKVMAWLRVLGRACDNIFSSKICFGKFKVLSHGRGTTGIAYVS
ncbi:hypothetical protein HAX54_035494 [Datura stramonium]|uniref:Rx N-terminal domain-containing protein n=1 Tax=Datura stramonium TaxID=4076 RepID=A0ABS8VFH3_DATST|nr:hypothetical protein [Datura stramonium]